MKRSRMIKRKSFMAALMLCLISALALTAGIVYNKKSEDKNPEVADLNETTAEYATVEEVREIVENNTTRRAEDRTAATENVSVQQETQPVQEETQPVNESVVEQEAADAEAEQAAAEPANAGAAALHFDEAASMQWPVPGEVILEYSMDNTIYFPTLDVYKCNSGMMIQGDENIPVCAAASGIVEDITVSREFGNMVSVNLGDGYVATYGQVDNIIPAKGEMVEKGQQIGTLASPTAYYEVEGYNLYFKLTKDGVPVNPLDYLKE